MATSLRVGTLVLADDYRHPLLVAKEAATLDVGLSYVVVGGECHEAVAPVVARPAGT